MDESDLPLVPADMHKRDPERLAEITGLQIDGPYDQPVFLKTGPMTQPVRLLVDAKGKPTKCDVLDAAQGETFSQHTCKTLIRYPRFEPARDMEGRPVASFYGGSVAFTF